MLCVELKYLYVACTRPKSRLIIYDEDHKNRRPIQRIWEKLDTVITVNSYDIEDDKLDENVAQLFRDGCIR